MDVVERLAAAVDALPRRRVLVAIDGPDAAGKTTMASAVAGHVRRPVVSASIDGWHNPRQIRVQRGELSPEGYFLDSFDLDGLRSECLDPFRAGSPSIRTASYDYRVDDTATARAGVSHDAVLLLDGVFLQRAELQGYWDLCIYLHVPEAVTLARALARDVALLGGEQAVRERYEQRYLPGQALYREHASPLELADIVLDNSDPAAPQIITWLRDRR